MCTLDFCRSVSHSVSTKAGSLSSRTKVKIYGVKMCPLPVVDVKRFGTRVYLCYHSNNFRSLSGLNSVFDVI